jgi:hypothetical protein
MGSYSEATAHACFKQLLEGVRYCHSHGVVHRDLKLENLLLEKEHELSRILIVDFGLAKGHFQVAPMAMDTVCGTPHYVAPEVIQVCHVPAVSRVVETGLRGMVTHEQAQVEGRTIELFTARLTVQTKDGLFSTCRKHVVGMFTGWPRQEVRARGGSVGLRGDPVRAAVWQPAVLPRERQGAV